MLALLLLFFFIKLNTTLLVTFPSSSDCKDGWIADFYHWDTEEQNTTNIFSGAYPRLYSRISQCTNSDPSLCVDQDFCTGYIDSMPLGSYCFYQNGDNGNTFYYYCI